MNTESLLSRQKTFFQYQQQTNSPRNFVLFSRERKRHHNFASAYFLCLNFFIFFQPKLYGHIVQILNSTKRHRMENSTSCYPGTLPTLSVQSICFLDPSAFFPLGLLPHFDGISPPLAPREKVHQSVSFQNPYTLQCFYSTLTLN